MQIYEKKKLQNKSKKEIQRQRHNAVKNSKYLYTLAPKFVKHSLLLSNLLIDDTRFA